MQPLYQRTIMTLFELIKSIVLITLFLCFAPFLFENIKNQYLPLLEPRAPIGVIHIPHKLNYASTILEQLHAFFKNTFIKGIVIHINGSQIAAGTSQMIFRDIRQLKKEYPKPIIVLVENICIAGSYLIASACDYIIAPESAIIGGIGTAFNKWALKKIDTEKHDMIESIETDSYQQLIKQIASSRKLSLTTTANWAEGKTFTATQALALGLINEIGSRCTLEKVIKDKALIEGEIELIIR